MLCLHSRNFQWTKELNFPLISLTFFPRFCSSSFNIFFVIIIVVVQPTPFLFTLKSLQPYRPSNALQWNLEKCNQFNARNKSNGLKENKINKINKIYSERMIIHGIKFNIKPKCIICIYPDSTVFQWLQVCKCAIE